MLSIIARKQINCKGKGKNKLMLKEMVHKVTIGLYRVSLKMVGRKLKCCSI